MIKIFVAVGIIGGLAIAYVSIFLLGPISQLPPSESLLTGFRAEGYIPASFDLAEDESAEEGVFGLPAEDEVQLEAAIAAAGANPATEMPAADAAAMEMGEGGLLISDVGGFDREIDLKMTEWSFSEMNIEVSMGERIRFNVVNDGEILHEFMVMEMTAMQAVSYRATRADWSLLEHEALYEKALVLPDGQFSFVMEVQADGVWMFMCMLPYHMEMGMMGQIATAGMAMDM
jgi:uncharacterized cupredoxin-like copper-binding protein